MIISINEEQGKIEVASISTFIVLLQFLMQSGQVLDNFEHIFHLYLDL